MKPRGTAGFAARIAGRYRHRGGAAGTLRMPLASLITRVDGGTGPVYHALNLVLRPRLNVAVTNIVNRDVVTASRPPLAAVALQSAASRPMARPASAAAGLIVERLRLRETRTESLPLRSEMARSPSSAAIAPVLPPPSLPMVKRPVAGTEAAAPGAEPRTPLPRDPRPQAASPAIPAAEVARITDQVMHTLNRRIAAERERVGRR